MKKLIIYIGLFSFLYGEIQINGDAKVCPKIDIIEDPSSNITKDLYFEYNARLILKADIGKGHFFQTKLGTSDKSGMSKMGVESNSTSGPGISNSYRPQVDFIELYFGYKKENYGLWGGVIPLKHNPAVDIHYYPDKLVDLPFSVSNNNSITGFSGYKKIFNNQVNWLLSINNNVSNTTSKGYCINYNDGGQDLISSIDNEEDCEAYGQGVNDSWSKWFSPDKEEENYYSYELQEQLKDSYTLGLDTKLKLGPISIVPRFLITVNNSDKYAPTTIGSSLILPKISGFTTRLSYFNSTNQNENIVLESGYGGDVEQNESTFKYDITHIRTRITGIVGPGKIEMWYDIAKITFNSSDYEDLAVNNLNFLWFSYSYNCYSGAYGSVTFKPTVRMQNGKIGSPEYIRNKFELTTEIKFK